jgi:branched-chain amino acid transport system permease protein
MSTEASVHVARPTSGLGRLDALRVPMLFVACALLLAAPYLGASAYQARTIMLIAILSLLTSGLNIVLGYAGELAVNQVFLYAVGAYVAGYLGTAHGVTDVLVIFVTLVVAAVLVGLISGIPGLRLGGWSLAMVAFFMVIIIPNLVQVFDTYTGGPLGMSIPIPTIFGQELTANGIYLLIVITVIGWFAVARNLILSAHGNAFLVLRQSPILAESLGISVFRLKLTVYIIGAVPCAFAGALFAWLDGFIAPDTFTFTLALSVLAASVFGGATSIYGALLGAFLLQYGEQQLTGFDKWELVVYGLFLLLAALILREGLTGLWRQILGRARRRGWLPAPAPADSVVTGEAAAERPKQELRVDAIAGETLRCVGASKTFGGNRALSNVSITAEPGQVTALIGPNGSGKTTLLNLICGYYRPTSGSIALGDRTISGRKPFKVARCGVSRTFQTPLVPRGMTTRDFVITGRYAEGHVSMFSSVLRLPAFRRGVKEDRAVAARLLGLVGIESFANARVSELPLGTRRLAEVARVLAAKPSVFLFDEVASGLDTADIEALEDVMRALRAAGGTVVLVEHNFPLVVKVSDVVHVLSRGELLVSGSPQEIQRNPRVLEEYMGSPQAVEDVAEREHHLSPIGSDHESGA